MLKGQSPTVKDSVWNIPISEIEDNGKSLLRPDAIFGVIIVEVKRKVEYSWACTFWFAKGFKGYTKLHLALSGAGYNNFSIATFFKKIFNTL